MATRKNTATLQAEKPASAEFAHHMAEALRIARENPTFPVSLYNDLAEAWLNFDNGLSNLYLTETEHYIRLVLEAHERQVARKEEC